MRIERMPRERIPQDEFVWLHAKLQQCAPHNRRGRFGKPVRTFLRSAGAARPDAGNNCSGCLYRLGDFALAERRYILLPNRIRSEVMGFR